MKFYINTFKVVLKMGNWLCGQKQKKIDLRVPEDRKWLKDKLNEVSNGTQFFGDESIKQFEEVIELLSELIQKKRKKKPVHIQNVQFHSNENKDLEPERDVKIVPGSISSYQLSQRSTQKVQSINPNDRCGPKEEQYCEVKSQNNLPIDKEQTLSQRQSSHIKKSLSYKQAQPKDQELLEQTGRNQRLEELAKLKTIMREQMQQNKSLRKQRVQNQNQRDKLILQSQNFSQEINLLKGRIQQLRSNYQDSQQKQTLKKQQCEKAQEYIQILSQKNQQLLQQCEKVQENCQDLSQKNKQLLQKVQKLSKRINQMQDVERKDAKSSFSSTNSEKQRAKSVLLNFLGGSKVLKKNSELPYRDQVAYHKKIELIITNSHSKDKKQTDKILYTNLLYIYDKIHPTSLEDYVKKCNKWILIAKIKEDFLIGAYIEQSPELKVVQRSAIFSIFKDSHYVLQCREQMDNPFNLKHLKLGKGEVKIKNLTRNLSVDIGDLNHMYKEIDGSACPNPIKFCRGDQTQFEMEDFEVHQVIFQSDLSNSDERN